MKRSRPGMFSVKEALDNLPSGICYFDRHDILRLCNRQMYRLGFALAGRELQNRQSLDGILAQPPADSGVIRDGENYLFPDGRVWAFQKSTLTAGKGNPYTEYIALDVTELYRRKKELEKSNAEQREMMDRLVNIARNVVSITREEEILTVKMKIHNDLGYALQSTRQFFLRGCPGEEKDAFVAEQKKMARTLLGEVGNDDEVDVYAELERIARRLGMKITTTGALPREEEQRNLVAMAVRECLTNTIRHAGGDEVYVKITTQPRAVTVTITNSGAPPKQEITPGGGLSSLRDQVERSGGTMALVSLPRFILTVKLPRKEEGT